MRKYQKISWDEIVKNYHSGDAHLKCKAESEACIALKGFIVSKMKKKYSNYLHREYDDLLQNGYMAVIANLGKYCPERGMPTTFFAPWIEGALQDWINTSYYSTSYYSTVRNKIRKIVNENEDLLSDEQIACETGLTPNQVKYSRIHDAGIEKHNIGDKEISRPSNDTDTVDDYVERNDEKEILYTWMNSVLTATEKEILYDLFGLQKHPPMSVSAIASKRKMTRALVGETRDSALQKLSESGLRGAIEGSAKRNPQVILDLEFVEL